MIPIHLLPLPLSSCLHVTATSYPFPGQGPLTLPRLPLPFSNIIPGPTDEPEVTIEGFDGNWYLQRMDVKLTCKADANPPATEYHWTT